MTVLYNPKVSALFGEPTETKPTPTTDTMKADPYVKIKWNCSGCGAKHCVEWRREVINLGHTTVMECDQCLAKTSVLIDRDGKVTPLDTKPAPPKAPFHDSIIQADALIAGMLYQSGNLPLESCQLQATRIRSSLMDLGWKPTNNIP